MQQNDRTRLRSAGRIDYAELLRGLGFSSNAPGATQGIWSETSPAAASGFMGADGAYVPPSHAAAAGAAGYNPGVDVPGQTISHKQYLGFVPGQQAGPAGGGAAGLMHGGTPNPAQQQWMQEAESAMHHGGNKLSFMAQSAQGDIEAGASQWQGRPDLGRTPAFTAWFTQMKTQLSHMITHYDKTIQELHERLGVFS